MKLFQQMLVAGASLSLLAPVAAQASDVVNLEDMNSYSRSRSKNSRLDSKTFINEVSEDIAVLKGRVDGLEAKQNDFEAMNFSPKVLPKPRNRAPNLASSPPSGKEFYASSRFTLPFPIITNEIGIGPGEYFQHTIWESPRPFKYNFGQTCP